MRFFSFYGCIFFVRVSVNIVSNYYLHHANKSQVLLYLCACTHFQPFTTSVVGFSLLFLNLINNSSKFKQRKS